MRRGRVRAALIAVVMLSLGSLGFVLGRTLVERDRAERSLPAQDLLPEVSQRIREFRRVKVADGRKVWELKAREAQYFEAEAEVVVSDPEVAFYDEDETVRLVGREGRVKLDGTELAKLDLNGGVAVEVGGYRLETEQALYDRESNSIVAPKGIHISGSDVDLTGKVLVVELGAQRVRIVGNVKTTFERSAEPGAAAGSGAEAVSFAAGVKGGADVATP